MYHLPKPHLTYAFRVLWKEFIARIPEKGRLYRMQLGVAAQAELSLLIGGGRHGALRILL